MPFFFKSMIPGIKSEIVFWPGCQLQDLLHVVQLLTLWRSSYCLLIIKAGEELWGVLWPFCHFRQDGCRLWLGWRPTGGCMLRAACLVLCLDLQPSWGSMPVTHLTLCSCTVRRVVQNPGEGGAVTGECCPEDSWGAKKQLSSSASALQEIICTQTFRNTFMNISWLFVQPWRHTCRHMTHSSCQILHRIRKIQNMEILSFPYCLPNLIIVSYSDLPSFLNAKHLSHLLLTPGHLLMQIWIKLLFRCWIYIPVVTALMTWISVYERKCTKSVTDTIVNEK